MQGLLHQDALYVSKRENSINSFKADDTSSRQSSIKAFKYTSSRSLLALSLLIGLSVISIAWAGDVRLAEAENTGWSFQFDNDVFVGGNKDQDYTGGFAITLSGNRANHYQWSPNRLRQWADDSFGLKGQLKNGSEHYSKHALEWGGCVIHTYRHNVK